jgi:hypothetical protein
MNFPFTAVSWTSQPSINPKLDALAALGAALPHREPWLKRLALAVAGPQSIVGTPRKSATAHLGSA